ncbi:hypothetical protein Droror1_Dr00007998 [Drosera rotundifolia]
MNTREPSIKFPPPFIANGPEFTFPLPHEHRIRFSPPSTTSSVDRALSVDRILDGAAYGQNGGKGAELMIR